MLLSYLIVYQFTHVILLRSPHKCMDMRGHSLSVRVCRSTLHKWQFLRASDSERSIIVRVCPHEMPSSKIVELILSLRVVVVTINFSRTGSTSMHYPNPYQMPTMMMMKMIMKMLLMTMTKTVTSFLLDETPQG